MKTYAIIWCALVLGIAGTARTEVRAAPHSATRRLTGPCMTPTSAATYTRDWIAGIASGTDSLAVLQRTSFRIPQTPDSAIAFVSDSAVCARAAVAHAVARGQSASYPADVVVLRIGTTRYLVWNYSKIGEFMEYHVFDDNWRFLSRIAS